jgi:anti-anti-sigma factor
MLVLPAEVDLTCIAQVRAELLAALAGDVNVLIADMTRTAFCDSAGVRTLVEAGRVAADRGAELRLVVPSAAVRRVFTLMGINELVPVYQELTEAMTDAPEPPRPG